MRNHCLNAAESCGALLSRILDQKVDDAYFAARGLKRHAGVWLLWALGVGAVISGHFSGWNLGLASGGWGGMFVATTESPLGNVGAALTVIIALITIYMQLQDPVYVVGVLWVAAWFAVGIVYFALVGRHKLILSPEEEFAMARGEAAYKTA
jgi:hypothetical protein